MSNQSLRPPGMHAVIWAGRADLRAVVEAAAGHEVPAPLAPVVDLRTREVLR